MEANRKTVSGKKRELSLFNRSFRANLLTIGVIPIILLLISAPFVSQMAAGLIWLGIMGVMFFAPILSFIVSIIYCMLGKVISGETYYNVFWKTFTSWLVELLLVKIIQGNSFFIENDDIYIFIVILIVICLVIAAIQVNVFSPQSTKDLRNKNTATINKKGLFVVIAILLILIAVVVPKEWMHPNNEFAPRDSNGVFDTSNGFVPIGQNTEVSKVATDEYGNKYEIKPHNYNYMMLSKTSYNGINLWNKGLEHVDTTGDIHIKLNNDRIELIKGRDTPEVKIILGEDGNVLYSPVFWDVKFDEYEKFKDWQMPKCIARFSFKENSYYIFSVKRVAEGITKSKVYVYKQEGESLKRIDYLYSSYNNFLFNKEPIVFKEANDVVISFPKDGENFKLNPENPSLAQRIKNFLMLLPNYSYPKNLEIITPKIINL